MGVLRGANLALAFLLELGALFAAWTWGFGLAAATPVRVLAGAGAVVAYAAAWGVFAAPKAARRLPATARAGFELVWFGSAAALAAASGHGTYAVVFALLALANRILLRVWHQQDDPADT